MSKQFVIDIGGAFVVFPRDTTEEVAERVLEVLTKELAQIAERTIRVRPRECPEATKPDEDVEAAELSQATEVTQQMVVDYNYILERGERLWGDPGVAVKILQASWRVQHPI